MPASSLLALGGEGVIRGGVMLKRALSISPVVIGLFVLSLGTASPTLAIAVQGAASGLSDLAIGVVLGATLINLLLILGLGALIQPMPSAPKVVLRDGGALLIASGLLVLLALHGTIARREGILLIGGFILYAVIAAVTDWRRSAEHSVACAEPRSAPPASTPPSSGGFSCSSSASSAFCSARISWWAARCPWRRSGACRCRPWRSR